MDTLTIRIDQITALDNYNNIAAIWTSASSKFILRGGIILSSFYIDAPFYVFFGMNAGSFIVEPFARKYIQGVVMPFKHIQGRKTRWKLFFEENRIRQENQNVKVPHVESN